MGRKPKIDDERVVRTLLNAIRDGNTYACSCGLAGISERTFYRWLERGEAAKSGQYRQFWQDVKKADADAEADRVQVIREAMGGSWTAAAWWLERRRKRDYGNKLDVTSDDKPITRIELVRVNPGEKPPIDESIDESIS